MPYCHYGYSTLCLISKCFTRSYYHNLLAMCNFCNTTLFRFTTQETAELRPLHQAISIPPSLCPASTERNQFKHRIEVQNQHISSGWNIFHFILNTRTWTGVWEGIIYIYINRCNFWYGVTKEHVVRLRSWFFYIKHTALIRPYDIGNMQIKLYFLALKLWSFIISHVTVKNVAVFFTFWPSLSNKMSKFYTRW